MRPQYLTPAVFYELINSKKCLLKVGSAYFQFSSDKIRELFSVYDGPFIVECYVDEFHVVVSDLIRG